MFENITIHKNPGCVPGTYEEQSFIHSIICLVLSWSKYVFNTSTHGTGLYSSYKGKKESFSDFCSPVRYRQRAT